MYQTLLTDQFEFFLPRIHWDSWMNSTKKTDLKLCYLFASGRTSEGGMHDSWRKTKSETLLRYLDTFLLIFSSFLSIRVTCKYFSANYRMTCHLHSVVDVFALRPNNLNEHTCTWFIFFFLFPLLYLFSCRKRPFYSALSSVCVCWKFFQFTRLISRICLSHPFDKCTSECLFAFTHQLERYKWRQICHKK